MQEFFFGILTNIFVVCISMRAADKEGSEVLELKYLLLDELALKSTKIKAKTTRNKIQQK